jgi:hypothetical protein
MNCNVHVFYKRIFSNKFGFILENKSFLIEFSFVYLFRAALYVK